MLYMWLAFEGIGSNVLDRDLFACIPLLEHMPTAAPVGIEGVIRCIRCDPLAWAHMGFAGQVLLLR